MSGLESLPPDQRAVLQLILAQGRGYADLATTLRLDPAAVRQRAHAGAAALVATAGEIDADTRGRLVDYLLGQQGDGERIVTYAELGDSPAALRWAQALRDQLVPVAREHLPEVPATDTVPAAVNGSGAAVTVPEPAKPAAARTTVAPAVPAPPAASPREPPPQDAGEAAAPRPSRLGGAILIAGVVALAAVLAIVLIGGDGDDGGSPSASTSGAQTQRTNTSTQPATGGTNARTQTRTVRGAVLRPVAGSSALGAALVQQSPNGGRLLAVEAARLPGNGAQEFYGIWLQSGSDNRFLGFVPSQVRANGTFTVSSQLPREVDLSSYTTVLVTTEGSSAVPTTPGTTVLSGPLRLVG